MERDANKAMARKLYAANAKRAEHLKHCLKVYALKTGEKGSTFGVPFVGTTDALALRSVAEVCPLLNLYHLGYFWSDTGRLDTLKTPKLIKTETITDEKVLH